MLRRNCSGAGIDVDVDIDIDVDIDSINIIVAVTAISKTRLFTDRLAKKMICLVISM